MKHKENIFRLRAEGKSYREIQEVLGCSKGTIAYHLGSGQKEKVRQRSQKRRQELRDTLREYKERFPCADCGKKYPGYILDFDHVTGQKIDNISKMITWDTWENILLEIKKCDIVCSNCHRQRTWQRKLKK
jgi:DNA-binding transcriptional MerR regulator